MRVFPERDQSLLTMLRRTNSRLHVLSVDLNVRGLQSVKALSGDMPKNWQTKARCHVLSSLTCSKNFQHVSEKEQRDGKSRKEVI
jgi:hypothetical protein